jgi:hypothetical protein
MIEGATVGRLPQRGSSCVAGSGRDMTDTSLSPCPPARSSTLGAITTGRGGKGSHGRRHAAAPGAIPFHRRLIASNRRRGEVVHERSITSRCFRESVRTRSPVAIPGAGWAPSHEKNVSIFQAVFCIAARDAAAFLNVGAARISAFFPRTRTVKIARCPAKGFLYRPGALRRTVLQILRRRARLTAQDLAGIAFTAGRPIIRPGYRSPTESEVSSTRRAIRGLVAAGKVKKCGRVRRSSRQRPRNIYAPTNRDE